MTEQDKFVSDYDGTVTDARAEAVPFIAQHTELLAERIGVNAYEMRDRIEKSQSDILAQPTLFGWEMKSEQGNNLVVAPATVDPYIYQQVGAHLALQELLGEGARLNGLTESDIPRLMEELFTASYSSAGTVLREGAEDYLQYLKDKYNLVIVTNSSTAKVEEKLRNAFPDQEFQVIGNARKMVIDEDWDAVPVSMQPEGFPRSVLLRRHSYDNILQTLGGAQNIRGIAGDIFELDLALPHQRRIQTFHLSETAPQYERDFYNGGLRQRADNLPGLLQRIKDTR